MGADGHLNFDTKVNESGFNSGIKKLGGVAKKGLTVLGGAVAGVTTAMGAGIVAGVKYNAGIEQYQTSFEVMTGSADKAAEVIEKLKKVGAETPFELNDLADTTQLLMNYGFTADDAMGKMMMLGDISQGSADKMNRIATAYGQMSSAGKVSLEDVKQMIEAGFNPLQEISESTGESMASLYERISKGTISVDEITASMTRATSEGGKYFQSMEKQSQTVNGLISTLKDNAQQLLGDVVKPITDGIAKDLLPGAISAIQQLTTAFKEDGTEGLIEAGGQILNKVLVGISQGAPGMIDTALKIIHSLLNGIQASLPQVVSAAVEIISNLIQGFLSMLPQLLEMGMQFIISLVEGISKQLPVLIPKAIECVLALVSGFMDNIDQLIDSGIELILGLAEGLVEAIPQLVEKIPVIIEKLVNAIVRNLPKIIESGIKIIVGLANGLIKAIPELIERIPEIIGSIIDAFMNTDWLQVGWDIISGIAEGIANAGAKIWEAIKGAVGSAIDKVKGWLGIHSPSTLFRDRIGRFMGLGVGVGFEKGLDSDAMKSSLNDSMKSLHAAVATIDTQIPVSVKAEKENPVNYPDIRLEKQEEPDEPEMIVHVTSNTYLDSEKIAEKTTPKVVKKINKQQQSRKAVLA